MVEAAAGEREAEVRSGCLGRFEIYGVVVDGGEDVLVDSVAQLGRELEDVCAELWIHRCCETLWSWR